MQSVGEIIELSAGADYITGLNYGNGEGNVNLRDGVSRDGAREYSHYIVGQGATVILLSGLTILRH